jgi:hypothetical protein
VEEPCQVPLVEEKIGDASKVFGIAMEDDFFGE